MSLLKEDNTREEQANKELEMKLKTGDNIEYKVEAIWDSAVYARESIANHLPSLYYLIFWKGYPKEENIWKPALTLQHLRKLLSTIYKDSPKKQTATSNPIIFALLIAKPSAKFTGVKQKRGQQTGTSKHVKKN